jgi:hypothetical protein
MRVDGAPPDLAGVAGVSDVAARDGLISCQLEGDVGPFLAALRDVRVTDLTIEPARLEEAFLEFYAEGEAGEAGEAGAEAQAA